MSLTIRTFLSTASLMLVSACALYAGSGLQGEYFNNNGLAGPATLLRTDASVNFDWGYGGPGGGISTNRFSARWTGQVEAAQNGAYKFATVSDSGIRLWVNNALIIDHWTAHDAHKDTSNLVTLAAGQKYNLKIEYYENTGNATARLLWTPPNQSEAPIPQASLFSSAVTALPAPTYLSDLDPTFAQNGWGRYQRDRSNGETGNDDGHTISLDDVKFSKGLGVHARSELRYNLARRFDVFRAFIGVDDEVTTHGSVVFQVWLDNDKAFESPVMHGSDAGKFVELKTTGKSELKLIVLDAGDGNGYDHADWADAHLLAGPPAPPPTPTNLTAMPGDTKITLVWNTGSTLTTNTSVGVAATFNVYRGTTAGGESTTAIKTGITSTQYVDGSVTNGTRYFYKVVAVNAAGMSAPSNEASTTPVPATPPPPIPTNLTATPGDKLITLAWTAAAGATSYNLYRGSTSGNESPYKTGIMATNFVDTGLTNGTKYFYKVAAVNGASVSERSNEASATPVAPPPPPAPTGLTAAPKNKQVDLAWTASPGADTYNVYRGTSANGESNTAIKTGLTVLSFSDTTVNNGTKYFYKVAAVNVNGTSDKSNEASATPVAPPPPPAPTNLTAAPGDKTVMLAWTASPGAATYNIYRGTKANAEATGPIMTGLTTLSFPDPNLVNGTMYFYKVAAVSANGTSDKSNEANAMPTAPGLLLSAAQKDAFRFLRQSTWGPTLPMVDHVVQVGKPAFIDEQIAMAASQYSQTLVDTPNMELVSEQFFQNAMQGQDQLRQRVAWALSQIFVVSAVKVDNTHAMVPYIRMLHARAFDNLKDVMHDMALSPAMGEFLDMLGNKKAANGILPNENFPREWMQLFSLGLNVLNIDGSVVPGVSPYNQNDVLELSRVLTGWTYGDTRTTNPTESNRPYYDGPMKPVAKYHDVGQKIVMGNTFPAGQTAEQDFDQALTLIFNHPNVGPFICRELIQRLVTSNPSPTYIRDVATVFNNNGQNVRGDLKAVVKAILLHPEAVNGTPTSGKFSEPALFLLTFTRALNASVVDHPFMSDFSQDMAQRIWFAGSVFNYFSPNFRSGALFAPELQIWTTATAMTRTNFAASLLSGGFGADVTVNYAPFTAVAPDSNALADTVDSLIMGGTMGPQMRQSMLTAIQASTSVNERVRTALYLAAASMQYQVEH